LAQPVASIARYTRGWEFHKYIPGIGHDSGRSAGVTVYWCCAFAGIRAGVAGALVIVVAIVLAILVSVSQSFSAGQPKVSRQIS
jgi:hypothetical protein